MLTTLLLAPLDFQTLLRSYTQTIPGGGSSLAQLNSLSRKKVCKFGGAISNPRHFEFLPKSVSTEKH